MKKSKAKISVKVIDMFFSFYFFLKKVKLLVKPGQKNKNPNLPCIYI